MWSLSQRVFFGFLHFFCEKLIQKSFPWTWWNDFWFIVAQFNSTGGHQHHHPPASSSRGLPNDVQHHHHQNMSSSTTTTRPSDFNQKLPSSSTNAMGASSHRELGGVGAGTEDPNVPAPFNLALEKQMHKSIMISWTAAGPPGFTIEAYNVYVNRERKTSVRANERCRALVEGIDLSSCHRVSVRTCTGARLGRDLRLHFSLFLPLPNTGKRMKFRKKRTGKIQLRKEKKNEKTGKKKKNFFKKKKLQKKFHTKKFPASENWKE